MSRRPSSAVRDTRATRRAPGRATPRPTCAPSRPQLDVDLDAPLYTAKDAERSLAQLPGDPLRRGGRGRARASTPRSSTRATSSARRSSGCASRTRRRRGADHRLLGRSRPARHADPARPDDHDRRRLRPRRVDLRRPRARARGRGDPHPGRDGPDGRRGGRRPARPVVRDRADAGGRLGARSADRAMARSRSCRSTSTRRWPRRRPTSTAATPTTTTRRRPKLLRDGDTPLDYPNQIVTNDVEGVAGDRARAAAVHDRRLERDAHRRPRRRPPAQPDRRPERDDPVRRLPGRGHARRAPPGRRHRGQDRRPDARTSAARSARSAASRRTPTRTSCSTGSATSPRGKQPGRPRLSRAASSSSTATRRPRSRSSRRSGPSASRPTSRTGTSGSRSTDEEPR